MYACPGSAFASSFLGAANLLPVTIEHASGAVAVLGDGQRLPVAVAGTAPGPATLALRQEDLVLGAAGGAGLQARVRTRVYLGSRNRYVLQLAGIEVKALTANDQVFDDGAIVTLSIEPQRVLYLPR